MISGGAGFENTRRLAKWLLVSTAIGVVAGVAAIAFDAAIKFVTSGKTQGCCMGTTVVSPSPAGSGGR